MNDSLDTILITGASRGLGANFAKVLANDGFRIIGIGRNRINLEKVISNLPNQQLNHHFFELDITDENCVNKQLYDFNLYGSDDFNILPMKVEGKELIVGAVDKQSDYVESLKTIEQDDTYLSLIHI